MKYIVMEIHLAYAVVLDENGRFLRVANMHYEVGQTVSEITELAPPAPKRKLNIKAISAFVAAACVALVLLPLLLLNRSPFASVYVKINPEVRIDVDKQETVISITPVNDDGRVLVSGYEFKGKTLDKVVNELVDRAIELEYLKDGGKVSVRLEADDGDWMHQKSEAMSSELSNRLNEKMPITVEITEHHRDDDDDDDDDDDI